MMGRKIIITGNEDGYPDELRELAEAMTENNFIKMVYTSATYNYVNGVIVEPPKHMPLLPDPASLTFCESCDLVIIYGERGLSGAAHEYGRLIKAPTVYLPVNLDTFEDPYVRHHIMKYHRFVGFSTEEQYKSLRNTDKFVVGIEKLRRVRRNLPTTIQSSYLTYNGVSDTINDLEDLIKEAQYVS